MLFKHLFLVNFYFIKKSLVEDSITPEYDKY